MRQNFYMFSLHRNPDLDDRIFDCLTTSMAAVQADDVRASFLSVSDLNAIIRSGWVLEINLTSQLCLAAISCMVDGPTHVRGGIIESIKLAIMNLIFIDSMLIHLEFVVTD